MPLAPSPGASWELYKPDTEITPGSFVISIDPLKVSAGQLNARAKLSSTLLITSSQVSGKTVSIPVNFTSDPLPWFTNTGFAHSASYAPQVAAPGMPFLIGGGNFGPATLAGLALNPDGSVSTQIGDTQVLFDGKAAPLIFSVNIAGTGYVAGIAPFELDGKTQTSVQVVYNDVASAAVTIPVTDAVPGLISSNSSGFGLGAVLNADQSVNSQGHPASPNDVVAIYGGGGGQTTTAGRMGGVTGVGASVAAFKLPVKVFLDGQQVTDVPYSGPAPDLAEGYFQFNFRIPAGARRHATLPVQVQIGGKVTQPGITVAVN